jgi:alanine racemase
MKNLLKILFRKTNSNQSLITISISKSALIHNLNEFRKLAPNSNVAPVLKSNAYGHGLSLVAHALENEGIPFYVIDSHFEARVLREDGISTPLLVIGYSMIDTILKNTLKNISFTITSFDALKELDEKIKSPIKIHLKIDTGMHRQGILPNEVDASIVLIKNNKNIILEGICSHFADADSTKREFSEGQIATWNMAVSKFREKIPQLPYWHISATAGHVYSRDAYANMTRLGLGLYGIRQGAAVEYLVNLKPVLEMTSLVSGIKDIHLGDCVGYGCTFIADRDMTIATIPVGYFEGVDRRLSNKGSILINEKIASVVGRVNMNIITVDISGINVKRDDKVVVISRNPEDRNSIANMARTSEASPYEIAVHIPAHLKRVLIG